MIHPEFTDVNKLFVLLFVNKNYRTFFSKYYLPKVFQLLVDNISKKKFYHFYLQMIRQTYLNVLIDGK